MFAAAVEPGNADNLSLAGAGQTGFPTTGSAYQPDYGGSTDAILVRLRLAPQLCLGTLVWMVHDFFERPGCLTCPPDPLRRAELVLVGEATLAQLLAERAATPRAATAQLQIFQRTVDRLADRGLLVPRESAALGFKAAECAQTLGAPGPR
ncbi:MAG: hypothetical protein QM767_17050 [Anaeromyxobacter sp.]